MNYSDKVIDYFTKPLMLLIAARGVAFAAPPGTGDDVPDTGHYYFSPEMFWIALALSLFFFVDMLYVVLRQRKTERSLKETVNQVNLLLNSAAEGIYGLDLEGRCTFCNPACLHLLGYERENELLGKNLHEMIHHTRADGSHYPADECKICHAYLHDSQVHLEDEVLWRADGSSFPVEYWSYPLRQGSKTVGAVVSFLDITERKQAEQQLKAVNKELDAFVYTVSHDLRTPISAVTGYVDLLQDVYREELGDEVLKILATIEEQGEKMTLIVEDLLALATAGNIAPPAGPVDVDEVVAYVLRELDSEMSKAGLEVQVAALPSVQVPESLLIQLFENLIGNALRYAGPAAGPIEVGGERVGARVRYFVRDHGRGIPKAEQEHVFEAFFRGSTGKGKVGSGVGLATVQKICRLYGGQAQVEDTPGGGTTFRLALMDAEALEESRA